jgi:dolichyl-phosphate beta-glucosyltransferase
VASKIFNLLINILFDLNFSDTQCGFKGLSKEAANKILPKMTLTGYEFDVELILRSKQIGLSIKEVPITWTHKENSKFKVSKEFSRMLIGLLKLWINK